MRVYHVLLSNPGTRYDDLGPDYYDQQRNIAAVMWPRFTCCNWCAGSVEAPERHFEVGKGFWPQLIPGG